MGSVMLYVYAQMVMFSDHAQDVLLFYAHAYWVGGSDHGTDGCSVCMSINSKFWGAN